jgi:2-methylcitrate dehydratase PrpD
VAKDLETRIGAFVADMSPSALAPAVLEPLRHAVLDCVACILAGAREGVSERVVRHVTRGGGGDATIIGRRERASPEGAALANGTMGHAQDYDDVSWSMWGHATAPVLPAVLAIAEANDLSGRDFLAAFLAGIEIEARLGYKSVDEVIHRDNLVIL